jgi:hypothetical protein
LAPWQKDLSTFAAAKSKKKSKHQAVSVNSSRPISILRISLVPAPIS